MKPGFSSNLCCFIAAVLTQRASNPPACCKTPRLPESTVTVLTHPSRSRSRNDWNERKNVSGGLTTLLQHTFQNRHGYDTRRPEHVGAVLRAACYTLPHCVPAVSCLRFSVVSVSVLFACAGLQCAHCLRLRSWRKVAAATPVPKERQCALHPHVILVPTSPSVDRERSRARLYSSLILLPVMFSRASSEEFLSLILLSDSAPSSEFLHSTGS